MRLPSFLAAGLVAAAGVHSLRLGLSGVAISMVLAHARATPPVVSDAAVDGLERRQGEGLCMSIDPSECQLVKRDEMTEDELDLADLNDDDDDDDDE